MAIAGAADRPLGFDRPHPRARAYNLTASISTLGQERHFSHRLAPLRRPRSCARLPWQLVRGASEALRRQHSEGTDSLALGKGTDLLQRKQSARSLGQPGPCHDPAAEQEAETEVQRGQM